MKYRLQIRRMVRPVTYTTKKSVGIMDGGDPQVEARSWSFDPTSEHLDLTGRQWKAIHWLGILFVWSWPA